MADECTQNYVLIQLCVTQINRSPKFC